MYYTSLKLTLLVPFMWQVKYAPQRYSWFSLFAEIMFYKVAVNTELVSTESLLLTDISSSYGRMFSNFILSWNKILFDKWTPVSYTVSFNLYCMLLVLKKNWPDVLAMLQYLFWVFSLTWRRTLVYFNKENIAIIFPPVSFYLWSLGIRFRFTFKEVTFQFADNQTFSTDFFAF